MTYQELLDHIIDAAKKCDVDLTDYSRSPDPLAVDRLKEICDINGITLLWDVSENRVVAKKNP